MNDPQVRTHSYASGAVTFQGYLRVLREQWRVAVAVLVLTAIASVLVVIFRPPEYTAELTLYAAAQPSGAESSALEAGQLAQQRVASYKGLVTSPRVTSEVVAQLGLDVSPKDVAERVTATSPPDSVLINLAVTGPSPGEAEAVANALGATMTNLVTELEKPGAPTAQPPVAIKVVDPAVAPTSPSSPGAVLTLAFGLLAGLALAAGAALARNSLDTSIKTRARLREILDAPILGAISFDRQIRQRPLIVQRSPQAPIVEDFRQLRTKLRFLGNSSTSKVYMITSALPTEGKTTTLGNLAIALGSAGTRTLVIEADLRQPRLAELVGLDPSLGLSTVATGQSTLKCAIQSWPAGRTDILAGGPIPPNPSELLAAADLAGLLNALRPYYDIILIDAPPILHVSDAVAMAPSTDGTILVCRFRKTRQESIRAAADALDAVSAPVVGTVLTMVPAPEANNYPKARTTGRGNEVRQGARQQRHNRAIATILARQRSMARTLNRLRARRL